MSFAKEPTVPRSDPPLSTVSFAKEPTVPRSNPPFERVSFAEEPTPLEGGPEKVAVRLRNIQEKKQRMKMKRKELIVL